MVTQAQAFEPATGRHSPAWPLASTQVVPHGQSGGGGTGRQVHWFVAGSGRQKPTSPAAVVQSVPHGQITGGGPSTQRQTSLPATGRQNPVIPESVVQLTPHGHSGGGSTTHSQGSVAALPVGLHAPTLPSASRQRAPHGHSSHVPFAVHATPETGGQPGGQPAAVASEHPLGPQSQQIGTGQVQSALHGSPPGQTLVAALPGSHCSPGSRSPSPQISLLAGAQRSRALSTAILRVPN